MSAEVSFDLVGGSTRTRDFQSKSKMSREDEVSSDLVGGSNQSGVLDTLKSRYRCVHEPLPAAATPHDDDRRYLTPLWVFEDREVDGPEAPLPPSFSNLMADQNIIDTHTIKEKITSVLKVLKFREPHVLVQIWSPTVLRKRRVLTTCDQPFGLGVADKGLLSYRLKSERSIIDVKVEHRDKLGSLGRVYRQKLPEWSLDVHDQDTSDNLHGYINLPVFESCSDCCVGVLEIITSSHYDDFAFEVQEVSKALKNQNLKSPNAFGNPRFSIIDRRQHELDEIYKALKTTCDLHALPIAQVWAPSGYSSYVAITENLEQSCSSFNRSCIGKVCMSTDDLPFYVRDMKLWGFHEVCRNRHLEKSQGVVGRSLSSCGTWFCEDVTKLDEDDYPLVHNARKSGLASCLAIYLKSLKEDVEHVIEFFLPVQSANETYVRRLMETVKQQINNSSWMQLDTISPPQVIGGLSFNWNFDSATPSSVNLLTEREEVPPPESENMENEPPNSAAGGARQSVVPYLENRIEDFHINQGKRSMKRKSSSTRMIGFEEISKHFGKSIDETATILKVSRSTLKRICRSLGIKRWPYRNGPDMSDADTPMKSNKTDVAVHTSVGSFDAVLGSFKKPFRGTTPIIHDPAVTKESFELSWKQFNSDADTLMRSNKADVAVHTSKGSLAQVSGAFNVPPGGTTHLARNPAVLTKKSSESSREQFKSDADPLMKSYDTEVAVSTSVGSFAQDFGALNEPFGGTTHITHDPAVLTQESSESSWEQYLNFAQEIPTNQIADETSDIDAGKGLL